MAKLLGTMTDKKLQETFTAASPRGQIFTHMYWQVIQHVVDRDTFIDLQSGWAMNAIYERLAKNTGKDGSHLHARYA